MIYPQLLLDVHDELIVDLFAGGGGASCGIELATGRQVDVAINHDAAAVSMHEENHPQTKHHVSDVFEVDPHSVTKGRPVGLLWASPDCTDHSKAKGGRPIRNRKRRALAWVVKRWAGQVRPRVILLENVEEFVQWGPLVAKRDPNTGRVLHQDGSIALPGAQTYAEEQCLVRDPARLRKTFRRFVRDLEDLGYTVEYDELRACDYGAPTIRKRLFLIARCDGEPIVWPEPTHGPGKGLKPYRSAAECIDWTEPMCSIFATREEAKAWAKAHGKHRPKRPLAEATMRRIARGVVKYVLEAAEPFIVSVAHGYSGGRREYPIGDPLGSLTSGGVQHGLVAPHLVPRYGERKGQAPRTRSIEEPAPVVVPTGNGASLVASFLARHWGGMTGKDLRDPHPTTTTRGTQDQLAAVHLTHAYSSNTAGGEGDPEKPTKTVVTGGHHGLVASFLQTYYGNGGESATTDPVATITTKDRLRLVTVELEGQPYVVVDIAMRMLQPRELYRAQGFPDSYVIDRGADGRTLTKTEQVRMVGNSVCPPLAAALVRANAPALIARDEVVAA